jgi:hypothetical protein
MSLNLVGSVVYEVLSTMPAPSYCTAHTMHIFINGLRNRRLEMRGALGHLFQRITHLNNCLLCRKLWHVRILLLFYKLRDLPEFLLGALQIPFSGFLQKPMRDYGIQPEVQYEFACSEPSPCAALISKWATIGGNGCGLQG